MAEEGQEQEQEQQPDGDGAKPESTDWKKEARKWEQRAKANETKASENASAAARLAEIEAANQTAAERAEARAKAAEDRAAALVTSVAAARIEAALTGVVPEPGEIVGDLDLSKFLGAGGEVDTEKVTALKAKYAALAPPPGPRVPAPNPAQGASAAGPTLGDLIRDAEGKRNPRESIRLKSAQLRQMQNRG